VEVDEQPGSHIELDRSFALLGVQAPTGANTWTAEQIYEYFESGGQRVPAAPMGCMYSQETAPKVDDELSEAVRNTVANYDGRASEFHNWSLTESEASAGAAARELFISTLRDQFLGHRVRLRVLDGGCGGGRDLKGFKDAGLHAEGIEPSKKMVAIARAYSGCTVHNTDFTGINTLGFKERFHGIFCLASLFHLPWSHIPEVLESFLRILEPGGYLLWTMPQGDSSEFRGQDGRHHTIMPKEVQCQILSDVGFIVVDVQEGFQIYNGKKWLLVVAMAGAASL